jgi:hypothetical protein
VLQHQRQSAQPMTSEEQNFVITINTGSGNALEKLLDYFDGYLQ